MVKRVITSIIGLPLLVGIVALGGVYLKIGLLVLSLVGMYELYRALSKKILPAHFVGYAYCIVYILFIERADHRILYMLSSIFVLSLLVMLVVMHNKVQIIDCAITMFGFYYVAFLLSNIYLVREFFYQGTSFGEFFVWMIFICAWACDTGAYFVGINFGKHKLTPILSPKKTVEGSLGGILTAALVAFIYALAVSKIYTIPDINLIMFCVIIAVVGAIFSQIGDLAASAIKRYTQIKDYGKCIPGHGGVLDRFDSVLFTAPAVYLVMRMLFYGFF